MRGNAGGGRRRHLCLSHPGRTGGGAAVVRRTRGRLPARVALPYGVRHLSPDRHDVPERVREDPPVSHIEEYRRIAVFGGVYGNSFALQAMLADARRRDVDAVFCLGDLGGFGPHPDRVFPLLREHGVLVLQGNYDQSLASGRDDCGCGYTDPRDNHYARISYEYTFRNTSPENKAWLATLPASRRVKLGPYRVAMCHGSPRLVNEFLWESTTPNGLIRALLAAREADVILCTHTGIKWHRALDRDRHVINVGVIGRPENDGTPRVWYTLLTAGTSLEVEFVPLRYDHERLAREMEAERLPREFIETIRTGWWTTCLENLPSRERQRGRF
ncbi:MAG: metallophosphoesterase [Candidatus Rokuibacteriota bacterium]|nr:MAG: metallophosphoesterase [Candidatus Rokubacteria bacterium]